MLPKEKLFQFEDDLRDAREIERLGVTFRVVDPKETFWDRFEAGTWEPDLIEALRSLVNPSTVFIDVGAWIGPTTLMAAALGAEVIAVEPDPVALYFLKNNIAANEGFANRVRIMPKAVAPRVGGAWLHAPRKGGDSMGTLIRLSEAAERYDVETITPAMLAGMVTDAARAVVKVDIEGAEYSLASHLDPLVNERLVAFMLSFHPELIRSQRVMGEAQLRARTSRLLEPFQGYRRIGLDDKGGPAMPLEQQLLNRNSTLLFLR